MEFSYMGKPINRKARRKKCSNKYRASPDEKKLKESCLIQSEAASFDMVSKSENDSVSSPLSKILTRLRKLDSIHEAQEAFEKLKTTVDRLALDVATLQKKEEANNKFIQEIEKGVKFPEVDINTHLKHIPTEELSSLRQKPALTRS